ncbi:MAG: hypothetical protein ACWA5Q_08580 [bacterium]
MDEAVTDPYMQQFRGSFTSALKWPNLDALWERVRERPEGWYIYAIGEVPPDAPAGSDILLHFIDEIDELLHREHEERYCGIVYADDLQQPDMIKIYDPNNLGVSCGFSDNPPLPGWVLSHIVPVDVQAQMPPPAGRRRWWQRIFGGSSKNP